MAGSPSHLLVSLLTSISFARSTQGATTSNSPTQTDFTGVLVLQGWHIAVIVSGVVFVLAIIAVVCYCKVCRKEDDDDGKGDRRVSPPRQGHQNPLRFGTSVGKMNPQHHR